jgi:hypothetical protein
MTRSFRKIRANDELSVGDRVGLACDQCDDVREGVIVGIDPTPRVWVIDIAVPTRDATAHLAAHGTEHAGIIAAADQPFAAEGDPATVTISASLAYLRVRDEDDLNHDEKER